MKWHIQLSRYVVVGLTSNAVGYLLYLLLTQQGLGPKLAMSLLYCIGVIQTFVFNRSWSFRHAGAAGTALIRYALVYALGYVVNLLALIVLVDQVGLPHQLVQGVMILAVAVMLFLAQRYWVFATRSTSTIV
jgi:putative flippase GtrA